MAWLQLFHPIHLPRPLACEAHFVALTQPVITATTPDTIPLTSIAWRARQFCGQALRPKSHRQRMPTLLHQKQLSVVNSRDPLVAAGFCPSRDVWLGRQKC